MMWNDDPSILEGHYARKQLLSKDWLISWSHRSRFELGLRLARELGGRRVLDYGCGDGTFLAMLAEADGASSGRQCTGAELKPSIVEDCRKRFASRQGLRFVEVDALEGAEHRHAYELLVCMEVLEHVLDVEAVLERFQRLVAPHGRLLISVPVETGLPLLVKQTARRLAGWRGIGDYASTSAYSLQELAASLLPGQRQHITRPVYKDPDGGDFHDHKGFNWNRLRTQLARRFEVERVLGSPLPWLPPHLGSQAWFVARVR
jgi:SAM-dependent methyltransferase